MIVYKKKNTGIVRWHILLYIILSLSLFGTLLTLAVLESKRQEQIRINAFHAGVSDLSKMSEIIISDRLNDFDSILLIPKKLTIF